MIEKSMDPGQSSRPTEIENLYARAHLQGARYWDFSASRKELRGQFRQRIARSAAERPPATPSQASEEPPAGPIAPGIAPVTGFHPAVRKGPVPVSAAGPAGEPSERQVPLPPPEHEATRWYALHALLAGPEAVVSAAPVEPTGPVLRPPALVVFSLAGGVGKTCLVATLGRALAAMGEHVLLADTASCGLLPFYFGSRESKPGVARTFFPSVSSNDAPVRLVSLETEGSAREGARQDQLLEELERAGQRANRILVDVATADRNMTSRLLNLRPTVLVPMLPDMSSVACLAALESLFSKLSVADAFYVLNQFDEMLPLHREVRERLRERLGGRLLPITLRRSSAVSEALAEGMTVIDYASESGVADDYRNLAGWMHTYAAPATLEHGGARWSER